MTNLSSQQCSILFCKIIPFPFLFLQHFVDFNDFCHKNKLGKPKKIFLSFSDWVIGPYDWNFLGPCLMMVRAEIKTELDLIFMHFLPTSCTKEIMIPTTNQNATKQTTSWNRVTITEIVKALAFFCLWKFWRYMAQEECIDSKTLKPYSLWWIIDTQWVITNLKI